ncbi:MAG: insulinase family protein [Sedimentisphaerales bacterium]|nr:insulinase family protein [Sedimentisphaerales bacterium]
MEFRNRQLANGLTIVSEINDSAKSAAVGFFVKTGSRDENNNINGASHFLEHMLFKGTGKLNAFEVNEAFDRTGAKFNAFTSEENTVFYAAVLPEYLLEVTGLWIELMRPALRNEDFEIEKNVIKEEIAMYKDLPNYDVLEKCRSLHFDGHPCGNSVLGTEKSIDDLTANQMRDYFGSRYVPNNMVLACAGRLKWEHFCQTVENSCGKWQQHKVERNLQPCAGSKKTKRLEKSSLAREHICLMSPAVSADDPRRFAGSLLSSIIGDDVGSRFFWELVDKALAETATMQLSAMEGTGVFYSYIRCGQEGATKVLDIVKQIFGRLLHEGVSQDELTKAKNKALSALVIKNELPMGRLVDLGFNWIYLGKYRPIADDINAIKAVTVEEVNRLIKQLKPGDFTQFSIGPAK